MANEIIRGILSAVVFRNEENGYSVVKLDSVTDGESFTAVGTLPDVYPGETLELTGQWIANARYGQQFRADTFSRTAPEGTDALFRYLASGVIRGIGPGKAREIVEKFGENALNVIEASPERLAEVRGITRSAAREMSTEFRRKAGVRMLIELLGEFGITPLVAMNLYKVLGDGAADYVRDNPYIVTRSTYGATFIEADRMAASFGFDEDSPERLEAALVFEMRHNLGNGHVFIPTDKLIAATHELIGASSYALREALDILSEDGEIVREDVGSHDACYLRELRNAEAFVAERLLKMAADNSVGSVRDGDELFSAIEAKLDVQYAEAQREAVRLAANHRIMVLTGGPGTGKTTSVRGILELFNRLDLDTLLCAPTGRAAKRMGELAGRDDAMTVHRALGAAMDENGELVFDRNEENTLRADAVIIDETSMMDILLMCAVLRALPDGCRLILVGDAHQLPSVGPGNVFADIIKSGAVPVVELTEIFRQAKQSAIVRAAHAVNLGEAPDITEKTGDMFFLKRTAPQAITDTTADLIAERLPKNMGIPAAQIQVLTPSRKGDAGTAALNKQLQQRLNPPSAAREREFGGIIYREGDRVMQIRNDYDIIYTTKSGSSGMGVYNGDLGVITRIDLAAETLTVDFDDKIVEYLFEQMLDLEPAYAVTVHKSQGSEYRAVILALPPGMPRLATRAVLYTAITRARELLIIVGDAEVFTSMIGNDKRAKRYSGLRARLRRGLL